MITGDGWAPFAEQMSRAVLNYDRGNLARVGFCDHTAGGFYRTLTDPSFWEGAGVLVHFAIARDGRIAQLCNIFDSPYAQGRLGPTVTWPPYDLMNRRNPNGYLISTEHEDAETVDGRTVFVPNAAWTPEQYAADLKVKRWCVEEVYRVTGANLLRFGIESLAGHHMFDSVNRAQCPGPAWRNEYRQRLYDDLTNPQEADMSQQEIEELADRRALSLVLKEMNWPEYGDGLYRPVSVAEANGQLLIELWSKDRVRPPEPVPSFWVRKP